MATTLGVGLLGIFIWEYVSHPEWFGQYTQEAITPDGEIDLSGLTPEEQAAVANIDNLTVLFNELGIESGGIPNVQILPESDSNRTNVSLQEALSLARPLGNISPTRNQSPFAEYLEQYQFAVQMPQNTASNRNVAPFGDRNLGSGLGAGTIAQPNPMSADQSVNPLSTALQTPNTSTPPANAAGDLPTPSRSPDSNTATNSSTETTATTSFANLEGKFSDEIVTLPGIQQPFLPTLPQMSPPPGTTGYTPPASLELMPPLPGRSAAQGTFPTASTPLPNTGALNLGTATTTPSLTMPDTNVNNGYVTPFVSTTPSVAPLPPPTPFSAPRPPGSYTGNGYINTFSNPSSPAE
jgi:hypothetical protein